MNSQQNVPQNLTKFDKLPTIRWNYFIGIIPSFFYRKSHRKDNVVYTTANNKTTFNRCRYYKITKTDIRVVASSTTIFIYMNTIILFSGLKYGDRSDVHRIRISYTCCVRFPDFGIRYPKGLSWQQYGCSVCSDSSRTQTNKTSLDLIYFLTKKKKKWSFGAQVIVL